MLQVRKEGWVLVHHQGYWLENFHEIPMIVRVCDRIRQKVVETHIVTKGRKRPLRGIGHVSMFDGIKMNAIHVHRKVAYTAHKIIPITASL